MGLGLFIVIVFPLFLLSLIVAGFVILFTRKGARWRMTRRILLLYAVALGLFIVAAVALSLLSWWLQPMELERKDVIGTYRIDRDMFAGPNADWQHEHFTLEITEEDSAVLRSKDMHGNWHTFSRPIIPQHYRNYRWRFAIEGDSTAHHILANTPALYRQRWGYYYVFRSPRFGNVFFRKED